MGLIVEHFVKSFVKFYFCLIKIFMKVDNIYKAFLFFMKQEYGVRKTLNNRIIEFSEKFIDLLQKHYHLDQLGEDFLWRYFIFQFNFWKKAKLKKGVEIDISFVVGKKAFQRFLDRNQDFDWQLLNDKRNYNQKDFNIIVGIEEEESSSFKEQDGVDIDDIYRRKFHNTERGFAYCLTYTLLCNMNSNFCKECKFIELCKGKQAIMFPSVYRSRNGK